MHYRIRIALQSAGLLTAAASLLVALAVRPAFAPVQQPRSEAKAADPATRGVVLDNYGKLPLSFEANRGQIEKDVKFLSRGAGYSLFLTPTEAVLSLKLKSRDSRANGETIRMQLIGANPSPEITGLGQLPGRSNYFIGNDPAKWRTNIPNFAKVKMAGVYPGVDLVYYGNQRKLEYDWIVAPGADANAINFSIKAESSPTIDSQGNLVLDKNGALLMHKPFVYQDRNGVRTQIAAEYEIKRPGQIGFHVDSHDASLPLVIDPVLSYSTYLGGGDIDSGNGIAVDFYGNAYVAGTTSSTNFPLANPFQASSAGNLNAFVIKLDASGAALLYSTYLGGGNAEQGYGIAVDSSGAAYVTGYTTSTNFPVVNAFQVAKKGSTNSNAFITKLNPTGNSLAYSTYLGGNNSDIGTRIAVDASGAAYVTGMASSTNFPTENPFQALIGSSIDVFVAKLSPYGNALLYSTYLGGGSDESGLGIAVDASGDAFVTGYTDSTNFPTANPFQAAKNGYSDAFIAKLNAYGNALVYSTYLGGGGVDASRGIAVDAYGAAYITGGTYSTNFPTANPFQSHLGGGAIDAFVAKLSASGAALIYSTYLGGGGADEGLGIAVDASGAAYATGWTDSVNFPTSNPFQASNGGGSSDVYIAKLNASGNALAYSSYLGGGDTDEGLGIAVDVSGAAYVTGYANSTNFNTANPFQAASAGGQDAFAAKIGEAQPILEISLTASNYINGGTVAAGVFRLKNLGPAALGELKVWLSIPGAPSIGIMNIGADGSFVIPAGFNHDFGPLALFAVSSALPRGIYEFSSRMSNPVTSQILSEDLNPFSIQ